MGILTKVGDVFGLPLGSTFYHLLLLLALDAALAMAWGEWQRARRERAQRLLVSMAGLVLVRMAYVVASLVASNGWADPPTLLPPLERLVDTASVCLLGWALMPPARRGRRLWDVVFGANLLVAIGVSIVFISLWGQTLQNAGSSADYNRSWQATVWSAWQMALIVLAGLGAVRNREEGWGTFLLALEVLFGGRVLQLSYPLPIQNLPIWDRLSNLVAYPLIAIAVYQDIVVKLRLQGVRLQDISQASLDQIKSLLYLFEANQQMSRSLELSLVLDSAVQGIARALDADQCAIAFPEEGNPSQMRLVAIHNPGRQGRGEGVTFPLDYQLTVQHAMRRKKYVIGEEADNVQLKVLFALLGSSEVGPLLVQPLVDEGESLGAVIVGNSRSRRPFTANEAKLCQLMADQVVDAIRNSRRYQGAQKRIEELNKEVASGHRILNQAKEQLQKLTSRLATNQAEMEELARREELAREARNALEIRLVSSRAEVDTLTERVSILESDLGQAHANAEAQLHWHEAELARREALLQEEAQATTWLQTVLQGMTAGILITDGVGIIQEANVAAEILLDRDGTELRELPLEEISDDRRWRQAVATAFGGEAVRLTLQTGANTLMCDVAPLEPDSTQAQVEGLVAILQDISTEADAQRDQLDTVAAMTREMRSPMTAIINYVDLLLGETAESIGESERKYLLHIKAAADRMVQMTNDLTRETSGEEQWTVPRRQMIDVGELIEKVVAKSSIQLEDKAITLDLTLPDDLPVIKADPDYVRRVLSNLLSNATLASVRGGHIELWAAQSDGVAPEPEFRDYNGDGFVIVSIKDAGGGLPDEALGRIFDRARPSRTPPGLGESGAGLALVKTLVEAHGGRLWVESESGVGTTFSFVLPVSEHEKDSSADRPPDQQLEGNAE
jgi:signal transduction histidine kinase/uncharacterized coiled-coil protein SlyX